MSNAPATRILTVMIVCGGLLGACSDTPRSQSLPSRSGEHASPQVAAHGPSVPLPSLADDAPREYPGLHNVVAYHENYYSGSVPEGDEGFDTLAAMGVRTIISVDGAEPDVAEAKSRGIRYIHLPIGYNGFDDARRRELVRATRDALARGPVYVHCHHGKHRSAGAAAAVAASMGWATPEEMVERMKVSGTAPDYKGLYTCTASASVLSTAEIDAVSADFPEVAHPQGLRKSMVEADEINERLKEVEKAGWKAPQDHPDLVPVSEAGRLADILRVLAETQEVQGRPEGFRAMLVKNAAEAQALEDLMVGSGTDPAKVSVQFKLVAASCKACHTKFRD